MTQKDTIIIPLLVEKRRLIAGGLKHSNQTFDERGTATQRKLNSNPIHYNTIVFVIIPYSQFCIQNTHTDQLFTRKHQSHLNSPTK